ncbi:DUF3883 domain-containing protein [Thioalkalivibrio sp. ALMg13-2]|uniref:DUF3883 domain-containing protein n=1 Tax=Thioalkalivibrio sp. ALMg13-2 TaxID=1158167 RepID=UPI0009DA7BB6|nr:DUF3883 domain-containing protein [Thioalkalivibrio sp. ALMg13-2]
MAVLVCNVGWMEHYQGLSAGDTIAGGGSYVKEEGRGHEVCNFAPFKKRLYGYVQPPGEKIDIERIGAESHEDSVGGVTVIWTATRPTGGTAVIGWYKDATVYRNYQTFSAIPAVQRQNGVDGYWISAPLNKGTLLPVDERTLEIPRQVKGSMGRANVWYADKPESAPIVKRVLELVGGNRVRSSTKKGSKSNQDQARKVRIEQEAICLCSAHFEKLGYSVESVERDNLGWDLEARSGKTLLKIEVKGLSGDAFSVELTPNEFNAFSELSPSYRLAVVTNALSSPELYVCRYSKEKRGWVVDAAVDGTLEIEIKKSASIKCI